MKTVRRVVLSKSTGQPYVVTIIDEEVSCTCKSYQFGMKRDYYFQCKHIIQVLNDLRREQSEQNSD